MSPKDRKVINFAEAHELNNRLRQNDKRQTEANRKVLQDLGKQEKQRLNKRILTHDDLDNSIQQNLDKLE